MFHCNSAPPPPPPPVVAQRAAKRAPPTHDTDGAASVDQRPLPFGGRRDRVATLLSSLDDASNTPRSMCTLAIYRRNTLGYAWLTGDDGGVVRCGDCFLDADDPASIHGLLNALPAPIAVVLPIKVPESVQQIVRDFAASAHAPMRRDAEQSDVADPPVTGAPCIVSYLSANEFSADSAHETLRAMWPERGLSHWSTRVDLTRPATSMALGALLTILSRRGTPVRDVEGHALASVVRVSPETLFELQVFRREDHPAAVRGVGSAREGVSLYSLLDRCRTPTGRATLRRWLLLPTRDPATINSRLNGIDILSASHNRERLTRVTAALRHLRPVDRIMDKIRSGKHRTSDYAALLESCQAALTIVHEVRPLAWMQSSQGTPIEGLSVAARLCESIDAAQINELAQFIHSHVDFTRRDGAAATVPGPSNQATTVPVQCGTVRVRDGANMELDEFRAALNSLDNYLTQVARTELDSLSSDMTLPLSVMFFPECGYVVHIATETRDPSAAQEFATPPSWTLLFETAGHKYYKTPATAALDASVGDVSAAVTEKELLLAEAVDAHAVQYDAALSGFHWFSELDCICALASTAIERSWCRPSFCEPGGPLRLMGCRHPLLCKTTLNATIPFSFAVAAVMDEHANGDTSRVCVITGANGSGKSVLSHAIAMTVLLAHVGSFVPCESALIPLVDMVVINDSCTVAMSQALTLCPTAVSTNGEGWGADTRILPTACAASKLIHSSYGHDLAVAGRIVRSATSASLVVMDEFGRGTLASDGAALLASFAQLWQRDCTNNKRPIAILTTHASEILKPDVLAPNTVQWLTMKVTVSGKLSQIAAVNNNGPAEDDLDEVQDVPPALSRMTGTTLRAEEVVVMPASARLPGRTPATHVSPRMQLGTSPFRSHPAPAFPVHSLFPDPNSNLTREVDLADRPAPELVHGAAVDDVVVSLFEPVRGSHRTEHSNALACASIAGLDNNMIARASELVKTMFVS